MTKTKVLVYGSLRQGMGNHRLLETSDFIQTLTIEGFVLQAYCQAFPACSTSKDAKVVVEQYEVTPEVFKTLDRLEGYPSFYNRTETPDGWIYHIDTKDFLGPIIDHGDWVKYKEEK